MSGASAGISVGIPLKLTEAIWQGQGCGLWLRVREEGECDALVRFRLKADSAQDWR